MTTRTLQRTSAPPKPRVRQAPSRRAGNFAALAAGVGAGITAAITLPALTASAWTAPGGVASSIGIITAMAGTYLALLSIVLMARLPWVEREIGQDRLTAWHRTLGPWTLLLITAHVIATPLGYAQAAQSGWWTELVSMTFGYTWMLPAAVAFVLMAGLGLMSWRWIRSRMSYETWHVAHLYFYLAVALGFGHQIVGGAVFLNRPLATAWWSGLYLAIAAAVIGFRVLRPLLATWRHDVRVSAVVPVDDQTTHVYLSGRDLDRLKAEGGQWFAWRFGTRAWWWQAHPYSLSAAPTPNTLRITVKNLGDQSGSLTALAPGTRVLIEGPYGAFRADRRETDRVVLIGAGIGMAPIRALLEELPPRVEADVIYRASSLQDMPLRSELERLVERRGPGTRLHLQAGHRSQFPLDAHSLADLVPGISECDVYACGPVGLLDDLRVAAARLGIPAGRIHDEDFVF